MEELIYLKNLKGYSMHKMARMLGVSPSHVSRVISGEKNLSEEILTLLKDIIRIEELILDDPPDISVLKYELEFLINRR